jgi:NAD dependent epimerase/dehydratase
MHEAEWKDRRVLVTGAGGFIGSHLVERLVGLGARVTAFVRYTSTGTLGWLDRSPVRESIEVIAGDIEDAALLGRACEGVDTVFHLAALIGIPYSYVAPASYVRTNVVGTTVVLEAARAARVRRLVHTSTSEVYGTARTVPMREDHPIQAQSPYAASKASADALALSYWRSFNLPVTVVRPFNTYGPRQSARAVIPTIITQAMTSNEIRLGSVVPTRDFTYVADTVNGFVTLAAADDAVGAVVNVGSQTEISIGELAGRIAARVNQAARVCTDEQRIRPEASEVDRLCADSARARALGWEPQHTLDRGLDLTIEWVRTHLSQFQPGEYRV